MADKKSPVNTKADRKDQTTKDLQPQDGQAQTVKGGLMDKH